MEAKLPGLQNFGLFNIRDDGGLFSIQFLKPLFIIPWLSCNQSIVFIMQPEALRRALLTLFVIMLNPRDGIIGF